jgi:outer membrane lipoprotein-sorting protein
VLRDAVLLPEGQWRRFFKDAGWETGAMIDDKPCDQVAATPFVGKFQRLWFDVRSGLLVKQEVDEPEGQAELLFEDYFDAGGIRIARRQTIKINDVTLLLTLDSVRFNQPIPSSTFDLPAEIARLLQKKSGQ